VDVEEDVVREESEQSRYGQDAHHGVAALQRSSAQRSGYMGAMARFQPPLRLRGSDPSIHIVIDIRTPLGTLVNRG